MDKLSVIRKPVEKELASFGDYFKSQFKSDVKLLDCALRYVGESTGKLMRPMLVMLIAKCAGEVNEKSYAAAAAMEMLHTASLLHDDVIDESDKRRGRPSVNAVFNNNVAVLSGDFLLFAFPLLPHTFNSFAIFRNSMKPCFITSFIVFFGFF